MGVKPGHPGPRVFSLSLGKDVILSEAKNLTHDRETLRFAQGDNEKALIRALGQSRLQARNFILLTFTPLAKPCDHPLA